MFNVVKNRIKQIDRQRTDMSKSHHERYIETQKKIREHEQGYTKKSDVQKHVEKELSRHFREF